MQRKIDYTTHSRPQNPTIRIGDRLKSIVLQFKQKWWERYRDIKDLESRFLKYAFFVGLTEFAQNHGSIKVGTLLILVAHKTAFDTIKPFLKSKGKIRRNCYLSTGDKIFIIVKKIFTNLKNYCNLNVPNTVLNLLTSLFWHSNLEVHFDFEDDKP